MQIPIGAEPGFEGVVDLLAMKAIALRQGRHRARRPWATSPPTCRTRPPRQPRDAGRDGRRERRRADGGVLRDRRAARTSRWCAGCTRRSSSARSSRCCCASATRCIGVRSLLDAVVDLVPAPRTRGRGARARPRDGSRDARARSALGARSPRFVFKTIADPFAGRLSLFRVCSGTLRGDTPVVNVEPRRRRAAGHGRRPAGQAARCRSPELRAGDLGVVAKLKETRTARHAGRSRAPDPVPADRVPRARDLVRHRAQDQGRRGEDLDRARPPDGGGPRAHASAATRGRTSCSSRATARSTSRSRSPR